uniref:Probable transposase IS891/IS1136/IS1341 domain-containing protein n=1 Tax=viral metagenome TaxID=1070528 RepID=A0A6C0CCP4_9ZZZZ
MTIHNKIFSFMTGESKNIYNTTIFHTNIFLRYQNIIFKELSGLVDNKKIVNIKKFDEMFYEIYDKYYNKFLEIKNSLDNNNNIIYKHIKNYLDDNEIYIVNDNYKKIFDTMVKQISRLNVLIIPHKKHNDELFIDLVRNILKSIYTKNFDKFKHCIINSIPCPHNDTIFIEQVKNGDFLFSDDDTENYKQILKNHPLFVRTKDDKNKETIKSNQNYIARIVYKYYTDCKIPSDLMCNIIAKAHKMFNSYFALLQKKIYAKKPSYLDKNAKFILPYFSHSRKLVNVDGIDCYRLTVGKYVADNFAEIMGDDAYKCLNRDNKTDYKKYAHLSHMKYSDNVKKISKGKNFIIKTGDNGGLYIDKNSKKIIDAYYVLVNKPPKSELDNLVLIEVNPIHDGRWHKVNFTYKIESDKNKPDPNKKVSIDLGIVNLMTIYDPNGEPKIIKGAHITNMNKRFNARIDKCKSEIAKLNPKFTQDMFKKVLFKRHNSIDNYLNNLVNWFVQTYKDCGTIIVGYNVGWKQKTNMGKKMNRKFYEIPYMKLVYKLRDKLAASNQKLEIINESYTSKCDSLALEEICRHTTYNGKRTMRGLFSSHPEEIYSSVSGKMIKANKKGVLLNADVNGAINIMRKWEETNGKEMKKIRGKNICNPQVVRVRDYVNVKKVN